MAGTGDTITGIENITGSSERDIITDAHTSPIANIYDGAAGDDDRIDYSNRTEDINVTLNGATDATVKMDGADEDTLRNIEEVVAGSGDDTITGDANDNVILGNAGDDTIAGGEGDDSLDGGAGGTDVADYSAHANAVSFDITDAAGNITATDTINADVDTVTNFERVIGTAQGDVFKLASTDVAAIQGAGFVYDGAAGNDTVEIDGTLDFELSDLVGTFINVETIDVADSVPLGAADKFEIRGDEVASFLPGGTDTLRIVVKDGTAINVDSGGAYTIDSLTPSITGFEHTYTFNGGTLTVIRKIQSTRKFVGND